MFIAALKHINYIYLCIYLISTVVIFYTCIYEATVLNINRTKVCFVAPGSLTFINSQRSQQVPGGLTDTVTESHWELREHHWHAG